MIASCQHQLEVSGELSAVSYQLSAVSYQLSAISYELEAITNSDEQPAVGGRKHVAPGGAKRNPGI
ncbi:MAG TPA: hypothetical protein VGQ81_11980 [Acidobacteriota bacterium]|nr:hypothetical protein [Acidobacteriota bacterium]